MLTSSYSLFYVTGECYRFLYRGRAGNSIGKLLSSIFGLLTLGVWPSQILIDVMSLRSF